jgi:hypothetical protein
MMFYVAYIILNFTIYFAKNGEFRNFKQMLASFAQSRPD